MKMLSLVLSLISFVPIHCDMISKKLQIGDKAPNFILFNQDNEPVRLDNFRGQKVALCFYPKDNTYGCTNQVCSLRDGFQLLRDANVAVLGISKGSVKNKQNVIAKQSLPFPLLIGTDDILKAYGVNSSLLRLYLPKRWTFLIDENGIIVSIIKSVDTKNHAQQILNAFNTHAA